MNEHFPQLPADDQPSPAVASSVATARQVVIKHAVQALNEFQDAVVAGEEHLTEWISATTRVDAALALGVSVEEITAARLDDRTVYRVGHRTRHEGLWPFLTKTRAFATCEKRVREEHPDAVLEWNPPVEDGDVTATCWVLSRNDGSGHLVDTGYTVTPTADATHTGEEN
ncbi:hypothetical protein [Streptomyces noursei]|uniref:hypothetical protein n=1 Tax=Streptomyces noursei TaxID=1971 RepID=UPI0038234D78